MKFRKKAIVIEAITFEELIEFGKSNNANIVDGMPWSFEYKGYPITHENDKLYLIPTLEGTHNMTPDDMLITGIKGEIYPCKIDIFKESYDSVKELKNSELEKNEITFFTEEATEILKFCQNGDIFIKGNLVENDKEVVDAMREFLMLQGFLKK